jgi:flagellar export protein FliJ
MAFQFSLAAVLRVRESIEKREERALQSIQREVARTLLQIAEVRGAIDGAQRERETALRQTISAGHLHTMLSEEQGGEQRLESLFGELQVLEEARAKQMQLYQSAHQGCEMLTDMRKKQKESYEREWLREEQKRLDDIFMARRHRIS